MGRIRYARRANGNVRNATYCNPCFGNRFIMGDPPNDEKTLYLLMDGEDTNLRISLTLLNVIHQEIDANVERYEVIILNY